MEETPDTERIEAMTGLFALMSARCEDGAAFAMTGQSRHLEGAGHHDLAERLHTLGEEVITLARAAAVLADGKSADPEPSGRRPGRAAPND